MLDFSVAKILFQICFNNGKPTYAKPGILTSLLVGILNSCLQNNIHVSSSNPEFFRMLKEFPSPYMKATSHSSVV